MSRFEWIVISVILSAFGCYAWYARNEHLAGRKLPESQKNLKQIGIALRGYHDQYATFPPAYVLGSDGKPWHSWRVLILPFLGETSLYSTYRFDEPWDGPSNRILFNRRPSVFASPLQKSKSPNIVTYLGVVSRRTMWPAHFTAKISDVTDEVFYTIHLIENENSDVIWSEPREMRERDAMALLRPAGGEASIAPSSQKMAVLFVDGNARSITRQINRNYFLSALTPVCNGSTVKDWPQGLLNDDRQTSGGLPEPVDISQSTETQVLAVPNTVLAVNQTSLYCSTVQIAWDQLRPSANSSVVVTTNSPAVEWLNSHPFPIGSLAEGTYFVGVSRLEEDSSESLMKALHAKFPNAAVKMLKNTNDVPGIRILTYLQKSMPFAEVLEHYTEPLKFNAGTKTHSVNSFGRLSTSGEGDTLPVLAEVVTVRHYVSDDDFVLILKTDSAQQDEIILAKIAPGRTLQETWESTRSRMETPSPQQQLRSVDYLQIPILSFGVMSLVKEVIGLGLPTKNLPERFVANAQTTIRFRLDEYGAELISGIDMIIEDDEGGSNLDSSRIAPRKLVFDRPFLIALKEGKAETPYFLAWIGNAELMELSK